MVVVHDYLTQRGGAERVALELLRAFPGAPLITSCWEPSATYPEFAAHDVRTLWPDVVPFLRRDPRRAFPFLARAFSQLAITDADVIVCSSSGWAHRVHTTVPKLVYCHNPPRWLYQPHDYLHVVPPVARHAFVASTRRLRTSDGLAAADAHTYIANSSTVARRIRTTYGIDAPVICPPRGLSETGRRTPVPGLAPGYLLTIGRARGYKNTDVVCRAVAAVPGQRLVVVGGLPSGHWPDRIVGLTDLDDDTMRWLYANAAALVAVAVEDFGLTVVEAQAFGVPTVALHDGGYLDSTVSGVTGVFVDRATPGAVAGGIAAVLGRDWDADVIRAHGEQFGPAAFGARMRALAAGAVGVAPVPLVRVGTLSTIGRRPASDTPGRLAS